MRTSHPGAMRWGVLLAAAAGWACADAPTAPEPVQSPSARAARFRDELATARWNARATQLLQGLPTPAELPLGVPAPPNGQAWASRMLTYLSLAQYRAALAASVPSDPRASPDRPEIPRVASAVASASFTVLSAFFGTDPGMRPELSEPIRRHVLDLLSRQLAADAGTPGFVGAGDRIGRAAAEAVLAQAAADGYAAARAPAPPSQPGYWVPNGAITRSLHDVEPFFLEAHELLAEGPPAAVGSPALVEAAAGVYAVVTVLPLEVRAAQVEIAHAWNKVAPAGPFTAGEWNRTAVDQIVADDRTELDAARILAYANVAAFDAQVACFATKFAYWFPRPSMVNSAIAPFVAFRTATGAPNIPNHPSYPSAHSCISAAFGEVLAAEFASEADRFRAMVTAAGQSRIYAGIHYPFDIEAGQDIGVRAATKALAGSLQ